MSATASPSLLTPRRPLLRVAGLTARFGAADVLRQIDLEIGPGEVVAVTGEPGAGKTTLVRCLAGDLPAARGRIELAGVALPAHPGAGARHGVGVVWQDLALCENLDVASNLMLGRETRRMMASDTRFHTAAASLLARLEIPIRDTTRLVSSLSGGQRQLLAMAKAIGAQPRLLLLDEPTAALGLVETAEVERLIRMLLSQGIAVLLATRDIEQMFRLAARILVLRHGNVAAELEPGDSHPDDVAALLSGQAIDTSARRQLSRLHGLADRLASADPSSSLSLILSTLGAALGCERLCIHVVEDGFLQCAASLGLEGGELARLARLELGDGGGPIGRAAGGARRVVHEHDGWWSMPVMGPAGVSAVVTVLRSEPGAPGRDELDLLTLYAGYAAGAVERDRLLAQVTARNRVLETIREMLETLAGPVPVPEALPIALDTLRRGLEAEEVGLLVRQGDRGEGADHRWRAFASPAGSDPAAASPELAELALAPPSAPSDGRARELSAGSRRVVAVPFRAPSGTTVLVAAFTTPAVSTEESALIEDAAHSLRLALEREEAVVAHQEATALRRSRQLQRGFLSRLSHELRTPLTAIRGFASSLMAPDVTWDGDSQRRFLERIAAESARLGRLVDDLLDYSAIESGVMRLQRDWCDIALVAEAAVACLPAESAALVQVQCAADLPPVWADHDRLEQVLLNLAGNALRHNPPGTRVAVSARQADLPGAVELSVSDDGPGFPPQLAAAPFDSARRHRGSTAGAGLGLSIARGIVEAHGGTIELRDASPGTTFAIRLPIETEDALIAAGAPMSTGADA